jgi:hypothetical protein
MVPPPGSLISFAGSRLHVRPTMQCSNYRPQRTKDTNEGLSSCTNAFLDPRQGREGTYIPLADKVLRTREDVMRLALRSSHLGNKQPRQVH